MIEITRAVTTEVFSLLGQNCLNISTFYVTDRSDIGNSRVSCVCFFNRHRSHRVRSSNPLRSFDTIEAKEIPYIPQIGCPARGYSKIQYDVLPDGALLASENRATVAGRDTTSVVVCGSSLSCSSLLLSACRIAR